MRDGNFNRIKVKSPLYVQLSLLRIRDSNGINFKRIVSIVQMNEGAPNARIVPFSMRFIQLSPPGEEFLTYFPQFNDVYNDVLRRLEMACKLIDDTFDRLKQLDIKDFSNATNAAPKWLKAALYSKKRDTSLSARNLLIKMNNLAEVLQTIDQAIGTMNSTLTPNELTERN